MGGEARKRGSQEAGTAGSLRICSLALTQPWDIKLYSLPSPLPRFPASPLVGFLADLLVALHFAFVLFVLVGGLLVLRWRWVAYLHLPAAAWGALIEFAGWVCPLTPLEQSLRRQAGMAGYEGGFVEHYILPVLYPSSLTRNVQFVLGALVLALNLFIYLYIFLRRAGKRGSR